MSDDNRESEELDWTELSHLYLDDRSEIPRRPWEDPKTQKWRFSLTPFLGVTLIFVLSLAGLAASTLPINSAGQREPDALVFALCGALSLLWAVLASVRQRLCATELSLPPVEFEQRRREALSHENTAWSIASTLLLLLCALVSLDSWRILSSSHSVLDNVTLRFKGQLFVALGLLVGASYGLVRRRFIGRELARPELALDDLPCPPTQGRARPAIAWFVASLGLGLAITMAIVPDRPHRPGIGLHDRAQRVLVVTEPETNPRPWLDELGFDATLKTPQQVERDLQGFTTLAESHRLQLLNYADAAGFGFVILKLPSEFHDPDGYAQETQEARLDGAPRWSVVNVGELASEGHVVSTADAPDWIAGPALQDRIALGRALFTHPRLQLAISQRIVSAPIIRAAREFHYREQQLEQKRLPPEWADPNPDKKTP